MRLDAGFGGSLAKKAAVEKSVMQNNKGCITEGHTLKRQCNHSRKRLINGLFLRARTRLIEHVNPIHLLGIAIKLSDLFLLGSIYVWISNNDIPIVEAYKNTPVSATS